jgi:hypothetical protein
MVFWILDYALKDIKINVRMLDVIC